jgi:hypothetical protein
MWIVGIFIIILLIIWATLLVLEATKALGKSFGSIIKKFIFPPKNKK